jgi:hypothetical protein
MATVPQSGCCHAERKYSASCRLHNESTGTTTGQSSARQNSTRFRDFSYSAHKRKVRPAPGDVKDGSLCARIPRQQGGFAAPALLSKEACFAGSRGRSGAAAAPQHYVAPPALTRPTRTAGLRKSFFVAKGVVGQAAQRTEIRKKQGPSCARGPCPIVGYAPHPMPDRRTTGFCQRFALRWNRKGAAGCADLP